VSAPAAGTHPAGDTVAGTLAARYPYLTPGQCGLLEALLLSGLASAVGRDCVLAVIRPQPDGALDISILIIGSATEPCPASCPAPAASHRPDPPKENPAMTDDQLPPDTCGQPLDLGEPLPPAREVIAVAGPWTVLSCVSAACTDCGAVPLDEDTGMTPHFASTSQAAQELAENWGWRHNRGERPKDDELLCPRCAPSGGTPHEVIPLACPVHGTPCESCGEIDGCEEGCDG
jgi:hypothetical protein